MIGLMIMNRELIINELDRHFNDPKCELEYTKDYELLLSVMLSAQTTDKSVNIVTGPLYSKYDSLEKLNTLSVSEIDNYIRRLGFHNTKSKNFKVIVSELLKIGYVPNDRTFLESLSGVGRKTTNVVLSELYNEPYIAVDTHVLRVSKRLGLASYNDDVLEVEKKLYKKIPKSKINKLHHQLVLFGRYYCKAIKPECSTCKLKIYVRKIYYSISFSLQIIKT